MKYKRLRISNYRGVDSLEIEFDSRGLTLVQGPNEVGKTSLGEAIGILFEYPDSASNKHVKAIRPVHQDAGAEIELEAESGAYRFTYFKRYHKKPETKLAITTPSPENHTGREAHDRAKEILDETLDIDLWKALTIQQGDGIAQPDLTNQQSLSAALDKAAGGVPTDQAEEGLFEKATEEYSLFYSEKKGKENKTLKDSTEQLDQADSDVSGLEKEIRDLEQDIENAARLQAELPHLKERESATKRELAEQTNLMREIESLETKVSEARLKLESAAKTEEMAARDVKERHSLSEAVDLSDKEYQELLKSSADSVADFERAEKQFSRAEMSFHQADQERRNAEGSAAIRRADFDYYNNRLFLEQLGERKQRIDAVRKAAARADAFLENTKVDQKTLKAIELAERDLLTAKAKLETAAPSIKLRGLAQCEIEIDDDETKIEQDECRELSVADRLRIAIPDRVEIEIAAGSSTDQLTREVSDARQALEAACRLAGVDNADSARNAFEERRDATRRIEEKERIEQESLRDLSYDELTDRLLRLEQTVPEYLAKRVSESPIAADLGTAKTAWEDAEAAHQQVQTEWEASQELVNVARSIRDELSKTHESVRVQLTSLKKDLEQQRARLDIARESVLDEILQKVANEARQSVNAEKTNVETAEGSLTAKNPEKIKALAATAESTLETIKTRRDAAQTELTEVQTRLKIHGEEGLHEKLQAAKSNFEVIASANHSLYRRAAAARLLYEIMCQERDKARQAYVAPLKDRVERLGRLVFDETFQVEIDESLQIKARTSDGITVPFESLSGGTKEQLSLIFRLACSMIVAEEGGMPLIMDDALGYTDPDRLRLMGAVLAKAAKECQIVIFTCVPDRYGNVGNAAIVSL